MSTHFQIYLYVQKIKNMLNLGGYYVTKSTENETPPKFFQISSGQEKGIKKARYY